MNKMWYNVGRCVVFVFLLFGYIQYVIRPIPNNEPNVVTTESGRIRGYAMETLLEKRPFHSFKGIPFAKSPIGERRFKVIDFISIWKPIIDDNIIGDIWLTGTG